MSENAREFVKQSQAEPLARDRQQKQQGCELLESVFREAVDRGRVQPLPPHEPPTIPHSELPAPQQDSQLGQEWNFYRREVGRLLADGQEGRFVLIKGDDLIGIWDTQEEAEAVALQRYLMQPCLIHKIQSREPVLRMSTRLWRWRS